MALVMGNAAPGIAQSWYVAHPDIGQGNKDGSSWDDPSGDLKAVLSLAKANDEIWVAAGTYSPGTHTSDTFNLKDGVKIYGGFPATGNPGMDDRNPGTNTTTLHGGNINYHVVTASGVTQSTLLDGFTITRGKANSGGGMLNRGASPTINNCIFSDNTAGKIGGGMYNAGSSSKPAVTNCTFSGNTACKGGGIYNNNAKLMLTNCTFFKNTVATLALTLKHGARVPFPKSLPLLEKEDTVVAVPPECSLWGGYSCCSCP